MVSNNANSNGGLTDAKFNTINNLYRAFNTDQPDLLDEVLAQDWEDFPLAPSQKAGREGLKPMIAAFRAAFTDLAFTPQEVVGFGERAAVRLVLSGRHVGDWMGVPATGRSFEIAAHEMHHFEGDRIAKTWHVEDWPDWRKQIGVAAD